MTMTAEGIDAPEAGGDFQAGECDEGGGTHSSAPAWKIPRTEEPGALQSMGSLRVGHD